MDYIIELINRKYNTNKGIYYFVDLIKEKYPTFKINEDNLTKLKIVELTEEYFSKTGVVGEYVAVKNELRILPNIEKYNIEFSEDELIDTFLHELIHALTSYVRESENVILEGINQRRISDRVSSFFLGINEGITQYIVNDLLQIESDAYIFETHLVSQLSLIIGKDKMLEIYSNNSFEMLLAEIQKIDKDFDIRSFILGVYAEHLVLIEAFLNGDNLEDKRRVAILEEMIFDLYLKTKRENDQEYLSSLLTIDDAEKILNPEEVLKYRGRQDISEYGFMDIERVKEHVQELMGMSSPKRN